MDDALRQTLENLRFAPCGDLGAMRGFVEDVEFVAIEHPLKGVALWATYRAERTVGQIESFFPRDASMQQIATVMMHAFEQLRPERKNAAR